MNKKNKIYLCAIVTWLISVKLFFLVSFYKEYWTMWKYSNSFFDFIQQNLSFFLGFVDAAYISTLLLSVIFAILLSYFYYTYFFILFNRVNKNYKRKNSKYGWIGVVFTYLGFGCIACGQTLLYSFLFLVGGGTSVLLSSIIGELSLIIGIIFLSFAIYRDRKIMNSNICKI